MTPTPPEDGPPTDPGRIWAGGWRGRNRPRPTSSDALEQRSLFGEILDWMFVPLLLLWPMSVAVTFVIARSLADAPFDRALTDRTEALAQQVRLSADRVVVTLPREARDLLAPGEDDVVYFQVIGTRGQWIAGEADLPQPAPEDDLRLGKVQLRTLNYRGAPIRIGHLFVDLPEGETMQPALVQVAETLDKRTRLANEIIKGVIFPQFMILPIAVLLVWFGLTRGLAPLKSLQRRIRDRAPDDSSPIDPRGAPEEIAPLVDAFNDLLERLNANVSVQKRFIADAAHQMKTPLAGLQTQSELALRERDPAELQRTLTQIARGSQQAAHLVNQLLSLARTEYQRDGAPLEQIDLEAFAREAVADWVPHALARGIDLGFEVQTEAEDASSLLPGQPLLLREMINNLVDNALRYAGSGAQVTVRVARASEALRLEVEDDGPGVPEAERERVFERFYRALGTGVDGSGLGLAIVREIVDQHGGRIAIEPAHPDRERPGCRFIAVFPRDGALL